MDIRRKYNQVLVELNITNICNKNKVMITLNIRGILGVYTEIARVHVGRVMSLMLITEDGAS